MEQENYDVLVFCVSNAEKVKIPNNIEIIETLSFESCRVLQSIIRIIKKEVFSHSSIESIKLSPSLTQICERSFGTCIKLREFEIPCDSQLQTIEHCSLFSNKIEMINIPPSLIDFQEGWSCGLSKSAKIKVMPNNPRYSLFENKFLIGKSVIDQKNYDTLVYYFGNDEIIEIPDFIERIYNTLLNIITNQYLANDIF